MDHLIQVLPDGGNRIQCVELKGEDPLLLVSAYMPCRGLSDNIDDCSDCLDQLGEIVSKYSTSHIIVLVYTTRRFMFGLVLLFAYVFLLFF